MGKTFRFVAVAGMATIATALGGVSPAAAAMVRCQPDEVAVWPNRIHVRCEAATAGIAYFAVPVSDASHAARMLSILSTALVAGRSMLVIYEPSDTSGAEIGCPANNCRLLQGAAFGK